MNDDWLTDLERIARELRLLASRREVDVEEGDEGDHGTGPEWLDDLSDVCAAIVNGDELPGDELREPETFVFGLHSMDGDNLGELMTPVSNMEAGDTVTLLDGSRYRVRRVVLLDRGRALDGLLQLEPVVDD